MSISYDIVDFLGEVRSFKDAGRLCGMLKLDIRTISPLHIGSGYEERDNEMLYRSFERYNGVPIIPGSSLKGVLRTISQAVSYSCVEVDKEHRKDLPFYAPKNCNCIVCMTFGRMGFKSRVDVSDFIMRPEGRMEIIRIPNRMGPQISKRVYIIRITG